MSAYSPLTRSYNFYFPDVDTLIRVESSPEAVIIRASRNTFTDQRKRSFIHQLAAEGFIPDDYDWFLLASSEISRGARWLIDYSWLKIDATALAPTDRFMHRLIGGTCLLWIALITVLLLIPSG
jgi:hypothetical protein